MSQRGLLGAFGAERPPFWLGVVLAAVAVALATAIVYALRQVAPAVSLSVVYVPAVLLVSAYWGLALGLLTSVASAAAFNFFQLPPVGTFDLANGRDWVALTVFTIVAAAVSAVANLARGRAREAERRRQEADLAAGLARELLGGMQTHAALRGTARRLAQAMALRSAGIVLGSAVGDERRAARRQARGVANKALRRRRTLLRLSCRVTREIEVGVQARSSRLPD